MWILTLESQLGINSKEYYAKLWWCVATITENSEQMSAEAD